MPEQASDSWDTHLFPIYTIQAYKKTYFCVWIDDSDTCSSDNFIPYHFQLESQRKGCFQNSSNTSTNELSTSNSAPPLWFTTIIYAITSQTELQLSDISEMGFSNIRTYQAIQSILLLWISNEDSFEIGSCYITLASLELAM